MTPDAPSQSTETALRLNAYAGNLTVEQAVFTEPNHGLRVCRVCGYISSARLHTDDCPIPAIVAAAARPEPPVEGALEAALILEFQYRGHRYDSSECGVEDCESDGWVRTRGDALHEGGDRERWLCADHFQTQLIAAARSGHDGLLRVVLDEIERSRERFGEWSSSGSALTDWQRFGILSEEVGEVAEALVLSIDGGRFAKGREGHSDNLDAELVQVAAVALGWLQARALSPEA